MTTTLRFTEGRVLSVLSALLFTSVLLTGCGIGRSAVSGSSEPLAIANFSGAMHGGQQPIQGATIQLWAVGMPTTGGGYGAGQVALISSSVKTASDGSFTITGSYNCPSGSYVYITGTGGQPTSSGVSNSALAMMTALGACANLTPLTFININEATTVAGVWALQQFATATYGTPGAFSIGAPSSNVTGLQNAFAATENIAKSATGAIPLTSVQSQVVSGTTVNVNVLNEQSKVGTLANVLAACVNSTDTSGGGISSACTSLFNSVKPAGRTLAAADTLQAALDMAKNPTNVGSASLPPYSLSSSTAPFQPSLSAAPADFTLGLAFGSTAVLGVTGAQTYFLYGSASLNIDSAGNVYTLNGTSVASGSPYNSISVLSPAGAPVTNYYGGTLLNTPRGMGIDSGGNIWVANNGSTAPAPTTALVEFSPAGTTTSYAYAAGGLYGLAIDGHDNVFVGANTTQKVLRLTGGVLQALNTANVTGPEGIAIDASNNVWSTGFSVANVYKFTASACSTACVFSQPTIYTGFTSSFDVAIDQNSIPWVSEPTANTLVKIDPATTANGGTSTAAKLGGLNAPQRMAMDGSSNIWVADNSPASVTEIASGNPGAALSPSTGFAHTYAGPRGIAVDMSGNVWIGNNSATNASNNYALTEIVGAGSPAVQPLSRAVALGKIGQLP